MSFLNHEIQMPSGEDLTQGVEDFLMQGGENLMQGGEDLMQGGEDLMQGGEDLKQGGELMVPSKRAVVVAPSPNLSLAQFRREMEENWKEAERVSQEHNLIFQRKLQQQMQQNMLTFAEQVKEQALTMCKAVISKVEEVVVHEVKKAVAEVKEAVEPRLAQLENVVSNIVRESQTTVLQNVRLYQFLETLWVLGGTTTGQYGLPQFTQFFFWPPELTDLEHLVCAVSKAVMVCMSVFDEEYQPRHCVTDYCKMLDEGLRQASIAIVQVDNDQKALIEGRFPFVPYKTNTGVYYLCFSDVVRYLEYIRQARASGTKRLAEPDQDWNIFEGTMELGGCLSFEMHHNPQVSRRFRPGVSTDIDEQLNVMRSYLCEPSLEECEAEMKQRLFWGYPLSQEALCQPARQLALRTLNPAADPSGHVGFCWSASTDVVRPAFEVLETCEPNYLTLFREKFDERAVSKKTKKRKRN